MSVHRFASLRRYCMALAAFTLAPAITGNLALAQYSNKPGKGPAYVSPPENDPNYSLMGEFAGSIEVRDAEGKKANQRFALQIRAVAGDRFEARAFHGGLPGESGHKSEAMSLIGLRSGESLVLSGAPWAIFVDPNGCSLFDAKGNRVGRLKRMLRVSPTLGAQPPEGATVIFDGSSLDNLIKGKMTEAGLLQEGATISPMFQDFCLHLEFRIPYMPQAEGQQRGNSGLYLQSRYECQVLDSFGTETKIDGLGALYRTKKADINMAFPPLRWQTYDIHFTAPRWKSDGTKIRDMHITSWINGVKVQDNVALKNKTGAGKQEEPNLLPTLLQDHGDPVRFRNIWVIDRGVLHSKFPIYATGKQRTAAAMHEWDQPKAEEKAKPAKPEAKPEATAAKAFEAKPAEKGEAAKPEAAKK